MANVVSEELPSTWSELGRQMGVPATAISLAARNLLSLRSDGPVPTHIPSPIVLGAPFVAELRQIVTRTSVRRTIRITNEGQAIQTRAALEQAICDKLDEHAHELSNNMMELVARELGQTIEIVQKVFIARRKALRLEREALAEEAAYAREQAALKQTKVVRRSEVADNNREAALGAHRQRPLPDAYKPGVPMPPTPPSEPQTPLGRPACFPQPGENVPLDEALRAAWIQGTAGMANERLAAEMELVKQYPPATIVDAYDAIELAYSSRPDKQRKEMERKAAKLAKAGVKPTSQAASTPTVQAPLPVPPSPSEAKKT